MKNSFTFKCSPEEQELIIEELSNSKYELTTVPYTQISARFNSCIINLYTSGKLLIQGKDAQDWVSFTLEPNILKRVEIGYEEIIDPLSFEPHIGVDESGKGDFFGPLVIASAYVDKNTISTLEDIGVKDSKSIKSDNKILLLAKEICKVIKNKYHVVMFKNSTYNVRYNNFKNLNMMLAWGHAQAIESTLEKVPSCSRALSDKFGPDHQIKSFLGDKGKKINLEQKTKAESDIAVAAASIIARAKFVYTLKMMEKEYSISIPKGCSDKVKETASELINAHGPKILTKIAKCHFKTTDEVLHSSGFCRNDLARD